MIDINNTPVASPTDNITVLSKEERLLWTKLKNGDIDVNSQQCFFKILVKGFLYTLQEYLSVRGKKFPIYMTSTGDDIMYLLVKGVDQDKEPGEQTNEDYIYSTVPRGVVKMAGINMDSNQLSSPHTLGHFVVDACSGDVGLDSSKDDVTGLTMQIVAEYRRVPIQSAMSITFILDNMTDSLTLAQQILSTLYSSTYFSVVYLGQRIPCSFHITPSVSVDYDVEFDGGSQGDKTRKISLDFTIESNFPVLSRGTIVPERLKVKMSDVELNKMYEALEYSDAFVPSHLKIENASAENPSWGGKTSVTKETVEPFGGPDEL